MSQPFYETGTHISAGTLTVFHIGVLKQYNAEISGPTRAHNEQLDVSDVELPLMLQDHKNEVSCRNIWIRKL